MKTKLSFLVLFISIFACQVIAQDPVSYKKVNGKSVCGKGCEIRVTFDTLPVPLPVVAEIRAEQRDVPFVRGNMYASEFSSKGYVSYCIEIDDKFPAGKLWIRFHYENPSRDIWVTESLNPTGKYR